MVSMQQAGPGQGSCIGTHATVKHFPLCAEMCLGPRSQFLLTQAENSDFSCFFITVLRDFRLTSMAAATESLPQTQGGSFWWASQSHCVFTHFKSKPLLADAWQRWVFRDEKVSWEECHSCKEMSFWTGGVGFPGHAVQPFPRRSLCSWLPGQASFVPSSDDSLRIRPEPWI